MKTRHTRATASDSPAFPDADQLAALRSWQACPREAPWTAICRTVRGAGESARGIIGAIRRQLISFALERQRTDLADLLQPLHISERTGRAGAVTYAIDILRTLPAPQPQIADDIDLRLSCPAPYVCCARMASRPSQT